MEIGGYVESPKYFDHHYISVSNLKRLQKIYKPDSYEMDPEELQEVFDFGHLVENCILQPHLADQGHPNLGLAMDMAKTFHQDRVCSRLLLAPDLRRQHEWYRSDLYGIHGRCKADADSKALSLIFEFKGLSITTEKAFSLAIDHFDYDMGLAWYMNASRYQRSLIVAGSKTNPKKLFKEIVERDHPFYLKGDIKAFSHVTLAKQTFPTLI